MPASVLCEHSLEAWGLRPACVTSPDGPALKGDAGQFGRGERPRVKAQTPWDRGPESARPPRCSLSGSGVWTDSSGAFRGGRARLRCQGCPGCRLLSSTHRMQAWEAGVNQTGFGGPGHPPTPTPGRREWVFVASEAAEVQGRCREVKCAGSPRVLRGSLSSLNT